MFTGIVTDLGRVVAIERRADTRLRIACRYPADAIDIGASISCNGACLTVVEIGPSQDAERPTAFAVDVSAETLSKTALGDWEIGTDVNLERSLRVGDELGGHIVLGHVDGVAAISSAKPEGGSWRIVFETPAEILRFVAPKGSIAIDGVSLTVNEVEARGFGVNIIPHTHDVTTFRHASPGRRVNIEVDVLARYVARLKDFSGVSG